MSLRRVVAGHDADGKAIILMDGDAPKIKNPTDDIESTLIWTTDASPASNAGTVDAGDRDIGIAPPPQGSVFRIIEFGPEGAEGNAAHGYIGQAGAIQPEDARHPGMHKTHSVDYAIIMTGEIDMLLDESEVHLKAGDVVVQRGNNHAWANRGDKPCKIAFVLIGADPV